MNKYKKAKWTEISVYLFQKVYIINTVQYLNNTVRNIYLKRFCYFFEILTNIKKVREVNAVLMVNLCSARHKPFLLICICDIVSCSLPCLM